MISRTFKITSCLVISLPAKFELGFDFVALANYGVNFRCTIPDAGFHTFVTYSVKVA
jgi:hypothetical protein